MRGQLHRGAIRRHVRTERAREREEKHKNTNIKTKNKTTNKKHTSYTACTGCRTFRNGFGMRRDQNLHKIRNGHHSNKLAHIRRPQRRRFDAILTKCCQKQQQQMSILVQRHTKRMSCVRVHVVSLAHIHTLKRQLNRKRHV